MARKQLNATIQQIINSLNMKNAIFFWNSRGIPAATAGFMGNAFTANNFENNDPSDPANTNQYGAIMFGISGSIKNVYVWLSTDVGAAGLVTVTLMKNGIATTITGTGGTGVTGNPVLIGPLSGNIAVTPTDLFSIQYANSALSANTVQAGGVLEFDPS